MALTYNNVLSFDNAGFEELQSVSGAPTFPTDDPVTGTYYINNVFAAGFVIDPFALAASAGNKLGLGFYVKFVTASNRPLIKAFEGASDLAFSLGFTDEGSGNISFGLTPSPGFPTTKSTKLDYVVGVWYKCFVIWEHAASGTWELFVDDVSQISLSGQDLTKDGTFDRYEFFDLLKFDNVITMSGMTGTGDIPDDWEAITYQTTTTGTTSDGGVLGNAETGVDAGAWEDTADTPLNAATSADFTSDPGGGSVDTAALGAEIDGDSNIKLMKLTAHLKRGAGTATTHSLAFGNSGDGNSPPATTVALTTTPDNYIIGRMTDLPLKSAGDAIRIGGWTDGDQDIFLHEMWATLLHVPSSAATGAGAQTLPLFTQAAVGVQQPSGVGTQTLSLFTQAASGTQEFIGTAAQTLELLGQDAAGIELFTSTVAQTLELLAQSSTGAVEAIGTAAQTIELLTQLGAGIHTITVTGSAAQTLEFLIQVGAGAVEAVGIGAQTLAALAQAGVGSTGEILGTGAQTLQPMAQTSVGVIQPSGTGASLLAALTQAGAGSQIFTGAGAQILPLLAQAGVAQEILIATGAQLLADLSQAASGIIAIPGTAAQALQALAQLGIGLEHPNGLGAQTVPAFSQVATGIFFSTFVQPGTTIIGAPASADIIGASGSADIIGAPALADLIGAPASADIIGAPECVKINAP